VPLIVRVPERLADHRPAAAGIAVDRLVSFVDFAPTVLSLAGVAIPAHMQGRAFLGPGISAPRRYVHGFRDRMDERYDLLRSVRDRRYRLIWNLLPHRRYAQWLEYMYQMPTMREWARLADEGTLVGPQRAFMGAAKPAEELYDTWADPHEVHNLAAEPEYAEVRARLRAELLRWMREIVDLGLLPEPDLRARFGAEAPYDAVRREPRSYPLDRLLEVAGRAGRGADQRSALVEALGDEDPAVRWWGAVGLRALGAAARPARSALVEALTDASPGVRVAAASGVAAIGDVDRAVSVLVEALRDDDPWVRLMAANALDDLDAAVPVEALRAARDDSNRYVVRVITKALRDVR
jgi:hypothetical protein